MNAKVLWDDLLKDYHCHGNQKLIVEKLAKALGFKDKYPSPEEWALEEATKHFGHPTIVIDVANLLLLQRDRTLEEVAAKLEQNAEETCSCRHADELRYQATWVRNMKGTK